MTITIRNVVDAIRSSVHSIANTVDGLEFGSPDMEVRGIATTFMATRQVIEQALSLDVNLLISHETSYYSHRTIDGLLTGDPVYANKTKRVQHSGLVIYRHHDYCHSAQPDPIMIGLLQDLKLEACVEEMLPTAAIIRVPDEMRADEIAEYVKSKLAIPYVRLAGDPHMICRRIGILVGYRGGIANAVPLYRDKGVDLVIAGEGPEWETPEYVRDSVNHGIPKALVSIGHAESEEPGMRYLAEQLRRAYPGLPVHFIASKPVFQVL
ncbi:Nif3-like dinuclear metal center hexameric protein [Paenibacillus sp. 2TAB23]|uniref:Nif3-like dinuclear metal center hexameric protein n=1 Tax=Paenibacillus sp. 2TAB23 TaxID=3233004 RepID=UPI003F96212F